jgi:hypothetical protein
LLELFAPRRIMSVAFAQQTLEALEVFRAVAGLSIIPVT